MNNRWQHPDDHATAPLAQPLKWEDAVCLDPPVGDGNTVPPGSVKVGHADQTLWLPPRRPMPRDRPAGEIRLKPEQVPALETSVPEAGTVWLPRPVVEHMPEEFDSATLLDPEVWAASAQSVPASIGEDLNRFGPGVPSQSAATWHGIAPPPTNRPRRRRRWLLLSLLIVVSVLAFLAWQHYGRPVEVIGVMARTDAAGPACNGTARVTGVLETDGGLGDVTYRWRRSDGTDSGVLTQYVPSGHHSTELVLDWTFKGHGTMQATATLEILTPIPTSTAVTFPYTCRPVA
ncbi:hypothetical protein [Streptomyces sp. NPDC057909]|uniref:hypothetical protein n=1 Tax=Streptomyces sp. NPDC057909 TaxID=3346277 RepID=UPI0036EE6E60